MLCFLQKHEGSDGARRIDLKSPIRRISGIENMEHLTLILLSLGLSLDDFGLAFALSLRMPSETF